MGFIKFIPIQAFLIHFYFNFYGLILPLAFIFIICQLPILYSIMNYFTRGSFKCML